MRRPEHPPRQPDHLPAAAGTSPRGSRIISPRQLPDIWKLRAIR
jgi:hypothetical protein